ncbi:ISNCY family transposase [Fimbriiglobus ruber]|uniref:Mobile element protein n=1 Tax=Fimbriiglobus ruber TaxID=1908690 RepID=A0A225DVI4_9BACT|nr:ISNCY family transposase [Fimbriiglobus ruber]OWK40315.1 Mobile element protein [Fimbriiglobus ruber]
MSTELQDRGILPMSQRERGVLAILKAVVSGDRTVTEAAGLLKLSVRQVRRLKGKLKTQGDSALVHGLRGQPSNRCLEAKLRTQVLAAYRQRYRDFGPTFACEKLVEEGLKVGVETLRRWLLAEGLWERQRRHDPHRSRRPRRACLGELVQMDASVHEWLEGRGEMIVLITMIDDATRRVEAKFYRHGSVESHLDLLGIWLRKYGRPLAVYTDRHSIFEPHEKGRPLADPDAQMQFGRALGELAVELIRAHSPQAKGRVERSFGTAQDRCRLIGSTPFNTERSSE